MELSIVSWVRRELNSLGIPPLKRFGQHFLVDTKIRDMMIDAADIQTNDRVIEVGAGLGFLTAALSMKPCRITAIEKDRTLAEHLRTKFSNRKNLTIVEGDALKIDLGNGVKIVSSPPYNISSKLILLILNCKFKRAVLLLQNEFVKRITAAAGSHDYGRLTVMVQSNARTEKLADVPRSSFYPAPRVDSAILRIEPKKPDIIAEDQILFRELVRVLFTQRRRKMSGVLKRYLKKNYPAVLNQVLRKIDSDERRIFEIPPTELISLSNLLTEEGVRSEHATDDQNSSRGTRESR